MNIKKVQLRGVNKFQTIIKRAQSDSFNSEVNFRKNAVRRCLKRLLSTPRSRWLLKAATYLKKNMFRKATLYLLNKPSLPI